MRHILVVANQTLHEDYLLDAVRSRMAEGPCEFTLLVPAIGSTGGGDSGASPKVRHGAVWRIRWGISCFAGREARMLTRDLSMVSNGSVRRAQLSMVK
jgi:hypothetical protein